MITSRINPLYVVLLFITVVIISFIQLNTTAKNYENEKRSFREFVIAKNQYINIKNKKGSFKKLEKILKGFSKKELTIKKTKKSFIVTVKNKDLKKLNSFLNNILKEQFNIKRLAIKKESIYLEILD